MRFGQAHKNGSVAKFYRLTTLVCALSEVWIQEKNGPRMQMFEYNAATMAQWKARDYFVTAATSVLISDGTRG